MSIQIVMAVAFAVCAARLLGRSADGRRYRRRGENLPKEFVRSTIGYTVLASVLCMMLIGNRPLALAGAIAVFILLGRAIVRGK